MFLLSVKKNVSAIDILQGESKDFDVYFYDIKYYPKYYYPEDFKDGPAERMAFIRNVKDDPSFLKEATQNTVADVELMLMCVKIRYEAIEYVTKKL